MADGSGGDFKPAKPARGSGKAPEVYDIEVGARIRLLRTRLKLSQQDLADACGVSFQQIQKYERGANRVSASRLNQIAAALKVKVSELLGEGAKENEKLVLAHARDRGALDLLTIYNDFSDDRHRRALLEFGRTMRDVLAGDQS